MALHDDRGRVINDFWSDGRNIESVFKLLAFAAVTGTVVRIIAGGKPFFPLHETFRANVAYAAAPYLAYLQFRYADASLVTPYMSYRESKGFPDSSFRYWVAAIAAALLGVVWPTLTIIMANGAVI